MKLKHGVDISNMHPAMFPMAVRADQWCKNHLGYELIITAGRDGQHGAYSRHWWGGAIDMRTWRSESDARQIPEPRRTELRNKLKSFLGKDWNVINESDHFHIGYKPTR